MIYVAVDNQLSFPPPTTVDGHQYSFFARIGGSMQQWDGVLQSQVGHDLQYTGVGGFNYVLIQYIDTNTDVW